jgi:hypothetical protein
MKLDSGLDPKIIRNINIIEMIEIAETIAIRKIAIGRIEIAIQIAINKEKKIKKMIHLYPPKYPCPSKYPCLLFLEKDANEKDQDPRSATTAETKPTTKVNFGTPFLGYLN